MSRYDSSRTLRRIVMPAIYGIFIAIIASLSTMPSWASDPSGWSNADIGADYGQGFTAGSDSYNSSTGVLTINGSGFGPQVTFGAGVLKDQFHFTYTQVNTANFRLIAKVTGAAANGNAPQVGVLVRAGTADADDEGGAMYASVSGGGEQAAPNEFGAFYNDSQTGCVVPYSGGVNWISTDGSINGTVNPPFWLELVKYGNHFAVYKSADGANWSIIQNLSGGPYQATGTMYAGFAVCGGESNTTGDDLAAATVTISNISLNTGPALGFETSWIGDSLEGDATGFAPSDMGAMWVDASGDCFTNFLPNDEDNIAPVEYSGGNIVREFSNDAPWYGNAFGTGQEGTITGDNNGNIYFWGYDKDDATYTLMEAATSGTTIPTSLSLSSSTTLTMPTGMAWDSNNSLLYVSDPQENEILAISPTTGGEVTADDFAFTPGRPGPIAIDGNGNLWIIQEGNPPGTDSNLPIGAPMAIYPAAVYCYNTAGVQQSIQVGNIIDTTKLTQLMPIVGATAASPIVITTQMPTCLATGDTVTINGVQGVTGANGSFTITVSSPTTFSLNSSSGSGTYTFGGNVSVLPGGLSVGWNPTAIAYENYKSDNRLLVTDDGPDQNIKIFNLTGWTTGTKTTADSTFGATGGVFGGTTPGLNEASSSYARFYGLEGVGTDSSGNIYIAESLNNSKVNIMADVRSLKSTGAQNWDLAGLTFVGDGDFDLYTGDEYTPNQHFAMDYGDGSGSEWSQYSFLWDPFQYAVMPGGSNGSAGGEYTDITRRINGALYVFCTNQGSVLAINIYRLNGEQMVPCGSITTEGSSTCVWSDSNGDGIQQPGEVTPISNATVSFLDFDVDSSGNIWLVSGADGYIEPKIFTELIIQGINTYGVPLYSVQSPSDYAQYALPAPFIYQTWNSPRLRYFASTDTMYVSGNTYEFPSDSEQATVIRINHFTSNPTIAWAIQPPVPDTDGMAFPTEYGGFTYMSLDVANDKLFLADTFGPISIYDANTGAYIGLLQEGPEVDSNTWSDDCYKGMHVFYNPADNDYAVAEENSGDAGRQNLYRWSPFTGSPASKSYKVTGATDASPIAITTSASNGLVTGDTVIVDGVQGNTAANGIWTVTEVSATQFDLTTNVTIGGTSTGNGTYTSNTGTASYGGVAGDVDMDAPGDAGSAYQSSGNYTVNGGGAGYGLTGGVDQINLCWTKMDGNGSISTQVTGLTGSTAAAASAGITIHNGDGTAGTQSNVTLVVTESNGLIFQIKPKASGATTVVATVSGITPSTGEYIKLVRTTTTTLGDTFTAYDSANGIAWTQIGSTVTSSGTGYTITDGVVTFTTAMSTTAYAGLAVTAANNSALATGSFDQSLLSYQLLVLPATPTGVEAYSNDGGVGLSWNLSPNAQAYNIYRGTTSGGETLLQSGVGSLLWTDTSAVNGTTYYYEITAVGTGGESARSSEVSTEYENFNPEFAWPVALNLYGFAWEPAGDAWTFIANGDNAGVSTFNTGIETATIPNGGSQAGAIQGFAAISQSLSGFQSNTTYTVTFYAAQCATNYMNYPQVLAVTMDGATTGMSYITQVGVGNLGTDTVSPPSSTTFTEYSFTYTTGASDPGYHTLEFTGIDPSSQNVCGNIDDIMFSPGL